MWTDLDEFDQDLGWMPTALDPQRNSRGYWATLNGREGA
jgi:hypothetical protein